MIKIGDGIEGRYVKIKVEAAYEKYQGTFKDGHMG